MKITPQSAARSRVHGHLQGVRGEKQEYFDRGKTRDCVNDAHVLGHSTKCDFSASICRFIGVFKATKSGEEARGGPWGKNVTEVRVEQQRRWKAAE